jgi:hypothetical protein
MTAALETIGLFLPIADHGDLVAALPFFLPAFLIVGAILAMRAIERRRDDSRKEP